MKVFKHCGWGSILALMISILTVVMFGDLARADDFGPAMPGADALATGVAFQKKAMADEAAAAKAAKSSTATCLAKQQTASALCNTMSMVGVEDPAQGAMMEMMMGQAMSMSTQIQSSGSNGAAQCTLQAKLSELMAGINAIKAAACAFGQSQCSSACDDAIKVDNADIKSDSPAAADAKTRLVGDQGLSNKCKQYTINTMMAAMQAVQFGGSMMQNRACAAALSQTPYDPALAGVTLPTGATNCSDPTMAASNVTCICAANPAASICGNSASGSSIGGTVGALGSSGPGSAPRPYGAGTSTDGIPVDASGKPAPQTGVTAASGGGGGGGIGSLGGGAAGGPSGDDTGGGAPVDKQSVIGGVSNGGGGGTGSPGNPNGLASKSDGEKSFFDKFNLSKFLPSKKNFGSRGLAGMSVQAKDGVTGPMGPSLWEKVTNQYQVQKPKMIQDR